MSTTESSSDITSQEEYQPDDSRVATEDREAEKSETTGVVSSTEVKDLGGDANILDDSAGVKTRGVSNDAYAQEKEVDRAVDSASAADE